MRWNLSSVHSDLGLLYFIIFILKHLVNFLPTPISNLDLVLIPNFTFTLRDVVSLLLDILSFPELSLRNLLVTLDVLRLEVNF
jgi:hypothetical protein